MLRIVAATRLDPLSFDRHTLLGRSVRQFLVPDEVCVDVAYANTRGLSEVFNAGLERASAHDVIVFTHDDVRINDWFLRERLREALERFAVVGVAGNRRRVPRQPAWAHLDPQTLDDRANLSGAVAHFCDGLHEGLRDEIRFFGEVPAAVKLLDGVFFASTVGTLRDAGIRFDPQFRYEFYDLDFCRSCERAGLTMGTWPIAITHASGGKFGSAEWRDAYARYLAKWKD